MPSNKRLTIYRDVLSELQACEDAKEYIKNKKKDINAIAFQTMSPSSLPSRGKYLLRIDNKILLVQSTGDRWKLAVGTIIDFENTHQFFKL